jgi:cardiolipin synthase
MKLLDADSIKGSASVQVVPSGPGIVRESVYQLLLVAIYSAQRELIITTPYFVPDDAVTTAILSAARRGVSVRVILPKRNDSHLVQYTSRSFFDDLPTAGVKTYRFENGLLHTKSILVDREAALFGAMNLDIRSFWLDFEVTLCIYDPDFGRRLLGLQQKYMDHSELVDQEAWQRRSLGERFLENLARLTSPLL